MIFLIDFISFYNINFYLKIRAINFQITFEKREDFNKSCLSETDLIFLFYLILLRIQIKIGNLLKFEIWILDPDQRRSGVF